MSIQPNPNIIGASPPGVHAHSPLPGWPRLRSKTPSRLALDDHAQSAAIRHPLPRRPDDHTTRDYRTVWLTAASMTDQANRRGPHIGRLRGLWPDDGDQPDVWTPPYSNPSVSVGSRTFVGGLPVSLDYSIDGGSPGRPQPGNTGINSATLPGDHYPGGVPLAPNREQQHLGEVRDMNNHTASQSFQQVGCRRFNPATPTAGQLISHQNCQPGLYILAPDGTLPRSWTLHGSALPHCRPTTPPNNALDAVFSASTDLSPARHWPKTAARHVSMFCTHQTAGIRQHTRTISAPACWTDNSGINDVLIQGVDAGGCEQQQLVLLVRSIPGRD